MIKSVRGFGIVNSYTNDKSKALKEAHGDKQLAHQLLYDWPTIPQRETPDSAGYDIRANETVTLPSFQQVAWENGNTLDTYYYKFLKQPIYDNWATYQKAFKRMENHARSHHIYRLVHTGIKAYFPSDEVLYLFNRSSNPIKRGIILLNGTGVIDADYYSNPSNDGELCAEFLNIGAKPYTIHRGDRIMQGVFEPYLLADNDNPVKSHRKGGLGSTGVK